MLFGKKKKSKGFTSPNFEIHHKVTVIQTVVDIYINGVKSKSPEKRSWCQGGGAQRWEDNLCCQSINKGRRDGTQGATALACFKIWAAGRACLKSWSPGEASFTLSKFPASRLSSAKPRGWALWLAYFWSSCSKCLKCWGQRVVGLSLQSAMLEPAALTGTMLCAEFSAVFDSLWAHGLQPSRFLCPWDSPGKNKRVGWHALLQGIFPTQGSNPRLLHCRRILYQLSHQGRFFWWSPVPDAPDSHLVLVLVLH